MHGEAIGFATSPGVAFAYLAVGGMLYACGKYAEITPVAFEPGHGHGAVPAST
jgi:AGZA family xanthine/uracil permease-like MFS transporter